MTEPKPPIPDEVLAERFPREVAWRIPRNVWAILLSWGMGVVLLSGLFAWKLHLDQQAAADRDHKQDQAMCEVLDIFISGPAPAPGPAGDRARHALRKMTAYRDTLNCLPHPT